MEKNAIEKAPNHLYHYVVHGKYIVQNAREYMDIDAISPYVLILPTYFSKEKTLPSNNFVKFAVFGYGNPGALKILADEVHRRMPSRFYEIRVISMDSRGLDNTYGLTCCSCGVVLSRQDMLYRAEDIDIFMILYEKNRYGLSCSGSIMEAISAMKPIIHLNNDCINSFNTDDLPIGLCCKSLDEMADKMVEIINNYPSYRWELDKFRANLRVLRERIGVESQLEDIRDVLTFEKKEN